ncbi:tetratricopeptide repeat protein [Mycolicibacterium aichiense]|uniref:Tetratricopeptide repeat protein n=2 Tax=Mycolicibacterium TaxID=1866885 RepID=A0AAD1HM76_9MYCO|nr:tetratricopeptide repeat protein [Mycolicibacterium aichiense]MCV7017781.1 tetratricopeptide repeat protein [Mycolicibacterium aichiense]BBX06606.1 hypothetical protein MAIC_14090 [Mycolicibacterium aichiense]STZ24058.1 photosystem I assembly protein Ycf3 [Mycolicibacterium aichiense]
MTVLGAGEAVRPKDEAVTGKANPVRPGDVSVPDLAAVADKRQPTTTRKSLAAKLLADATRAHERALRRVDLVRSSNTLAALAQSHAALGNDEEALSAAREALELGFRTEEGCAAAWVDPSSVRIATEILTRYGHAESAYEALRRAPVPPSLCLTFASVAAALDKPEEALSTLAPYDNWAVRAFRGYVYASSGEFPKAIGELRRALRDEPNDTDSLLNLAISLWGVGATKKACRIALRATRSAPGRKDASLFYLDLLLDSSDVDRLKHEISLLEDRKVVPDARFLEIQGRALLLRGEWTKAITKLASAGDEAEREGDEATEGRVRSNLVRIKHMHGRLNHAQAAEQLEALVLRFPGNDIVAVNFAEVAGRRRDASVLRRTLSEIEDSTSPARLAYLRHQIAALEGDNGAAAIAAEEWFNLESDNPMAASAAMTAIGIFQGDWPKAIAIAEYALEHFPGQHSIINHSAYVLAMGGRAREAIEIIEAAPEQAERDFVLNATLGLAHLANGDIDQGMRIYRDAADEAEKAKPVWRSLMTIYQGLIVRQLGLDKTTPTRLIDALALVPVPLPEDWEDRPDYLRLQSVCEKNRYPWPPNL